MTFYPSPKPACTRIVSHRISPGQPHRHDHCRIRAVAQHKLKFYSWRDATCAASLGEGLVSSIAALGFRPELLHRAVGRGCSATWGLNQKDQPSKARLRRSRINSTTDAERWRREEARRNCALPGWRVCSTGGMISAAGFDGLHTAPISSPSSKCPHLCAVQAAAAGSRLDALRPLARRFERKEGFEGVVAADIESSLVSCLHARRGGSRRIRISAPTWTGLIRA